MIRKLLAIILLVMIASLSVAGCTTNPTSSSSTSTPQPTVSTQADYSSNYDKGYQAMGFFLDKPFTKSTNIRGNDVYMGSMRNASLPGSKGVTVVEELTKSQAAAKQLYDKYVSDKLSAGYTSDPRAVANWKTEFGYDAVWYGASDPYLSHQFYVMYRYSADVNSWEVTTEASN